MIIDIHNNKNHVALWIGLHTHNVMIVGSNPTMVNVNIFIIEKPQMSTMVRNLIHTISSLSFLFTQKDFVGKL